MAAQQAQFAETIRAMKLALKRKADGESRFHTPVYGDTNIALPPSILMYRIQTQTAMHHSSSSTRIVGANTCDRPNTPAADN